MSTITLEIPESQVVAWVQQLSPVAKRAVLKALIPEMEQFEALVDYGSQRIRDLCAERGSEDRPLLSLGEYEGIRILSSAQAVAVLSSAQ